MTGAVRSIGGSAVPGGRHDFGAFGRAEDEALVDESGNPDFVAIQQSPEFIRIRRKLLRFAFPMTLLFFCWYMAYVLLAAYASDFMGQEVFGRVTVGILLGLGQFASTVLITLLYVYFAKRKIDPRVDELRARAGMDR